MPGAGLTTTSAVTAQPPPELVCAEIWGGNRPINSSIKLPGIRGKVFSRPCQGGRGGDIHYISICSSGLLSRLCLADVAGHGQAVAMVSGEIHRLLRRYMNNLDQRRVLSDLNRRLVDSGLGTMTTAAAVSYFPPIRMLSVSYAGHPPAWLYRRQEDHWFRLPPRSAGRRDRRPVDLPLAVDLRTSFTRRKLRVHYGDRVLLVTDGVLEAPAPDGELYGEARLERLLDEKRRTEPGELADAIVASVVEHTRDPGLRHDDLTLLVVEFAAGPRAFGIWQLLKNRLRPPRRPAPIG
jgi:sigma-B regulation protein RsbU (phosphoserine phosphatase)